MKVWITKYALTKGVYELEAEEPGSDSDGMITVFIKDYRTLFHKGEWYATRELACEKVLKMIDTKRASIKKQLAKLAKLEAEYV